MSNVKSGANLAAELRQLADWIESDEGQANAEDKGFTEESWIPHTIADLLHYADLHGYRPDRALFNGWLRYNGSAAPNTRREEFHNAFWKLMKIVDKK